MNNEHGETCPNAWHYRLPEDAYLQLRGLRDQLHQLERLTAPRTALDDRPDTLLALTPAMLTQCFGQLARQLDSSLASVRWTRRIG